LTERDKMPARHFVRCNSQTFARHSSREVGRKEPVIAAQARESTDNHLSKVQGRGEDVVRLMGSPCAYLVDHRLWHVMKKSIGIKWRRDVSTILPALGLIVWGIRTTRRESHRFGDHY
jgi:hypothetical protein